MMDKNRIRVYDLHDPSQYADDKAYWKTQSAEAKLAVLEHLRESVHKLGIRPPKDGDIPRLRRVLRVTELK